MKNIYIDTELVLAMYNSHPYFSLKNLGEKSAHYTWRNVVIISSTLQYCLHICNMLEQYL